MPSIDVKLAEATWVSKEVYSKVGVSDLSLVDDVQSSTVQESDDVVLTIKVRCEDAVYQLTMPTMPREQVENMVDDLITTGKLRVYVDDDERVKSILWGKVQYLVSSSKIIDPSSYEELENG